jgi:prephenate dehydrogenase
MNTVAIVGVGLIGGSFGLGLRNAGFAGEILGVSSPAAIAAGLERGAISSGATLEQATAKADLIYLAQPVDRILETLDLLGPLVRPGCLVTDAGSTKGEIVRRAAGLNFVGGHPLAGKEQRGAGAAEAGLFRDRPYVLTPLGPLTSAAAEFRSWLGCMGAKIIEMTPAEHDAAVALTSHLPQLVSTALAGMLGERANLHLERVAGPGLIDMTRLALSSPDLWLSILATNQGEVVAALDDFQAALERIRAAVLAGELVGPFTSGAAFASTIRKLDF